MRNKIILCGFIGALVPWISYGLGYIFACLSEHLLLLKGVFAVLGHIILLPILPILMLPPLRSFEFLKLILLVFAMFFYASLGVFIAVKTSKNCMIDLEANKKD